MMRKQRLALSIMLLASIGIFFSCKEEEIEKKVENSERVDALRAELRQLELEVLGAQKTLDLEKLSAEQLASEIEELKENYDKVVKYTVTVVDLQGKLLPGMTVITNQAGQIKEVTTNSEGRATFDDMRGGTVAVVVKNANYATANFTATLYAGTSNYQSYGASSRILMFPLAAALNDENSTTFKGKLYYNETVVNDTLGGSASDKSSNPALWKKQDRSGYNIDYDTISAADNIAITAKLVLDEDWLPEGTTTNGVGAIIAIAYEDAVYNGTWDGKTFTLKVPARSIYDDWFDFRASFSEFSKTVTLNVNNAASTVKAANAPKTYTEDRVFRMNNYWFWGDMPGETLENDGNYYYSSYKF